MEKTRTAFFIFIICFGIALAFMFYYYKPKAKLDSTLSPVYMLFGHATKGINRAITEIIPVDSIDEKKFGEAIKAECDSYNDPDSKEYVYVKTLMDNIQPYVKKPFGYKVYIHESESPNAFALPGGVIFVTRGLLRTLKSESEIMSVLAHETAHIELSHCMDVVRFELLANKTGAETLGKLADFAMSLLLNHSFSKTQEDEADMYAFEFLKNSKYDPSAQGMVFASFIKYEQSEETINTKANVIRDYFLSHPPLALREEKYSEKARMWWKGNKNKKRYVGKKNLIMYDVKEYNDEWKFK